MQFLIDRLADIFVTEPDNAARAAALLLAIYVSTFVPLLTWTLFGLLKGSSSQKQIKVDPSDGKLGLPSAEQTALLIRKRRTIALKDYSRDPVDRTAVEALLEAANWAPTHGKTEPWRWIVMNGQQLKSFVDVTLEALEESTLADKEKRIAKLTAKREKLGMLPWAIAICFKRQALKEKLMPEWEELAATATAVQNMHLMATAMKLGGMWSSWTAEEVRESPKLRGWLGLEEGDRCLGVFYVAATDSMESYRASRRPVAEKVTWRE